MRIGFVGWRGMVGSVLVQRIEAAIGFANIDCYFFSTSQVNAEVTVSSASYILRDAYDLEQLQELDVIVTCQGSAYTEQVHPKLRNYNWQGYWLDAASKLRMSDASTIILDPINIDVIEQAIANNKKDFIGGNCTVSLLLLALAGLLKENQIQWVSSMTYQAVSGAGANAMKQLFAQNSFLATNCRDTDSMTALELESKIRELTKSSNFPTGILGNSLATNVLAWIDEDLGAGTSKEEWKATAESNKILGNSVQSLKIDGICARVSSMRCHSQALVIKLEDNLSVADIENLLCDSHQWLKLVANNKLDTLNNLTADTIAGTLDIAIGRIRQMNFDDRCYSAYTIGDQLLWGAAEPIVRMLKILINK